MVSTESLFLLVITSVADIKFTNILRAVVSLAWWRTLEKPLLAENLVSQSKCGKISASVWVLMPSSIAGN